MPFKCISIPLNLYTCVFGCGCGFGFEQKFWIGSTDLAKKRNGSADLHTPIYPPLKRKASVFICLRSEERFQKAPFSRRISVDGRPNRRYKAWFSNFSSALSVEGA